MPEQLELLPDTRVVTLTDRQQLVLDAVKRAGSDGLDADEAGAIWHANKDIHHPDTRCFHCGQTGQGILESLAAKDLVHRRRANRAKGIHGAWIATGTEQPQDAARFRGMLPDDQPLPY